MESINIISQYVAPWALSKEEIPIHLMWEPSFSYDSIIIKLPDNLDIKEFFNVSVFDRKDSTYIINELKTPNFFGFIVVTTNIIDKQHIVKNIEVEYLKKGKIIYEIIFSANIFRPFLTIEDAPDTVVLTDDSDFESLLYMKLKVTGFGHITIRNETSSGGTFIERAEPLYREIFRKNTYNL